jgi:hypothetical protein
MLVNIHSKYNNVGDTISSPLLYVNAERLSNHIIKKNNKL